MPEPWDVVVVGAGPAGATSALLLARAGNHVVLLDRARFPRSKACAEYLSPGVLQLIARLGLMRPFLEAQPWTVSGMEIVSASGARHRIAYSSTASDYSAATLERRTLDHMLVREAVKAGVNLREGFVARRAHIDNGRVAGVEGSHDGVTQTVKGRMTLICDGNTSTLSKTLGLVAQVRWPVRTGLVAHYEGPVDLPDGFGQMHVGAGGYCGVAPLAQSRVNVALVVRPDALRRSHLSATAFFERWIQQRPQLNALLAGSRPAERVRGVSPIAFRVSRPFVNGALLVGDAAGFFDPFTGEGIYRALKGAEVAAEVAVSALRKGDTTSNSLSAYQACRRDAFRSKQAATALVQVFVCYPRLMDYALPRLSSRPNPATTLARVLGDVDDAGMFLHPSNLWATLRP